MSFYNFWNFSLGLPNDEDKDNENGSSLTEQPEGDMEPRASIPDEDFQHAIINGDVHAEVTLAQRSREST